MSEVPDVVSILSEIEQRQWQKIEQGLTTLENEFHSLLLRQNSIRRRQLVFIRAMQVFWQRVREREMGTK